MADSFADLGFQESPAQGQGFEDLGFQPHDAVAQPVQPSNPDFEVAGHSSPVQGIAPNQQVQGTPGPSENFISGLLTNQPTVGMAGTLGRTLPASIGGVIAGPLGAGAFESARQGLIGIQAAQGVGQAPTMLDAFGRPVLAAGIQQAGDLVAPYVAKGLVGGTVQGGGGLITPGIHQMGEELGGVAGMIANGASSARGALNRFGAGVMKVAANVPENSGNAALGDLGLLSRAPSNDAVNAAYDAFHEASGTMSRKEFIANSNNPFDTVSRAINTMKDANAKLADGTLTHQEAVNASQAARIIRDQKMRGNEMAQEVADTASELKAKFDNFIQTSIEPKQVVQSVPVAQKLVPKMVNEPQQVASDITPDLRNLVKIVNRAKGQGVSPRAIMSESERALYSQFQNQINSSAEHSIPIETLLTQAERNPLSTNYVEKQILTPGEEILGPQVSEVGGRPGYPEYQRARQMAFENNVAQDLGSPFARNVNGSPNVLRTVLAMQGGATTGASIGAALGGPAGAVIGAGLGGAGGFAATSPLAYGTLIKGAGYASRLVPSGATLGAASRYGAEAASALTPMAAQAFSHMSPESISAFYRSPGATTP